MEERIDYFGKYSKKMHKIHYPVLSELIDQLSLDFDTSVFHLIQCDFSEYLEHHPDEPKYFFDLFSFEFGVNKGHFVFAFNTQFVKTREEVKSIVNSIKDKWYQAVKAKIEFVSTAKSINDLNLEKYAMLQSAHYQYPHKNLIDDKIDYQIFKIIYPYTTLKPVLDMWDSL